MMPIFDFDTLKHLAKSSSIRHDKKNVFNDFKLFAFIVHDPDKDHELDMKLNQCFDRLDYITGNHLLCFSLAEPPEMWLAKAKQRDYFKFLKKTNNDAKKNDDRLTVLSISALLNIPMDDFPCIIVTKSFESRVFFAIKTSAQDIEQQLTDLGHKAHNIVDYAKISPEQKILDLNNNIANVIYEAIPKCIDPMEKSSYIERKSLPLPTTQDAFERSCISNAINISRLLETIGNPAASSYKFDDVQMSIEAVASPIEHESHFDFNPSLVLKSPAHDSPVRKSSVQRSRALILTETSPNHTINNIREDFLAPDSSTMLKTAEAVYLVLNSMEHVDFAPAAICYAKAFENEINLSIVHWARQKLGVQLPQYYNRKQANVDAFFTPNFHNNSGHPIDLNKGYKDRWAPPSMGQSELVCIGLAQNEKIPPELTDNQWQLLMQTWGVIRKNRNEASHTHVMSKDKMIEIRDSIILLEENELFKNLAKIKNRLKSVKRKKSMFEKLFTKSN